MLLAQALLVALGCGALVSNLGAHILRCPRRPSSHPLRWHREPLGKCLPRPLGALNTKEWVYKYRGMGQCLPGASNAV